MIPIAWSWYHNKPWDASLEYLYNAIFDGSWLFKDENLGPLAPDIVQYAYGNPSEDS